jgi:hypothetical protein
VLACLRDRNSTSNSVIVDGLNFGLNFGSNSGEIPSSAKPDGATLAADPQASTYMPADSTAFGLQPRFPNRAQSRSALCQFVISRKGTQKEEMQHPMSGLRDPRT